MEEEREDLLPQILLAPLPVLAAVHEHVVLAGVGVEVAVEEDGALLQDLGHQLLDVEDGGEGVTHHVLVLPVQVTPRQVTPSL